MSFRSDVAAGGVCANTTGTRTYNRPNMRLAFSSSTSFVITPKDDLTLQENSSSLRTIPKDNMAGFQLAPNPTSSLLNITYTVEDENSDVTIKLYNMMGKLVAEFNPQNQTNGNNSYEVNLNSVSNIEELQSGIYLCSLSINGEIETKKFMLIK